MNSSAQREGDVTRLITTQEFPASIGICHLRFWFHMYGSHHMGTLKVRQQSDICVNKIKRKNIFHCKK